MIESGKALFWNNRPYLYTSNEWVWEAFWAMSPSREVGMGGAGYIPLGAVLDFCRLVEEDEVERRFRLLQQVRLMDNEYLKHVNESRPEKGEAK